DEIELDIQEGVGQLFDWVINWFEDDLTDFVKAELEAQVSQQVAPLVAGLLEEVADFTFDFELPAIPPNTQTLPMRLVVSPSDAVLTPSGLELELTGGFGVTKGIEHQSPGSLSGGCVGVTDGPGATCVGACGGKATAGCWCDTLCLDNDDCCDDYWPLCGDPPTEGLGACCATSSDPGCGANTYCEDCVCAMDAYCCNNQWDVLCTKHAATECDVPCGCSELCCAASTSQSTGCAAGGCEDCVCDADSYCCENEWDGLCASVAAGVCDNVCQCSETCCDDADTGGCPAYDCEGCVCDLDDYCCDVKWDGLCASTAEDECAKSCGCYSGDTALLMSALPHEQAIEMMAVEAVMNAFFFATWWGGHLDVDVDHEQLAATIGDLGLPGLTLSVDPHLPPIVTGCTSSGTHELQLGDVLMTAGFELLGQIQSITFFASARVAVTLELVETDEGLHTIGIVVGEVIEAVAQLVGTDGGSSLLDSIDDAFIESALSELFIAEYLTGVAAAVPSKAIDLGQWVPGLPTGSNVAFDPGHIDVLGAAVMLGGELVSVP
ncbi:MAG: hypothetical protein QF464_01590, partial [Myxococcota bacterium]|nr:hypothetical protein [Myxococcota bacterium]